MDFSEKLQNLRRDRNWTQEQLSEQLFVSRTAVSKWESGRGTPSIDSLKAISRLFSVSIDDLLSGEELITITENESKEKARSIGTTIFGVLDSMAVLILFLPLFGQQGETMIEMVSLLSLVRAPIYIRASYFIWTAATTLWGILTLALQSVHNSLWLKTSVSLSLALSILGTTAFVISQQPYAAILIFSTLLLKGILLIKRA
ncbi:helix-turn-helix transcriptional regulator [Clostridium sp. D33t1_170424_F3]|uniref:helix-turn-helix domain-containing protein n=1 Tax=Clostridium sp. D33t1_170424_F3 TaxID=2787099 RepID=UPI0018A9D478|nr:helix-turn-helix transcriptional regulator [Clostridium sp. D33t1_170424_F3]